MKFWFKLTPSKWQVFASASSNIGQAIILFSLSALFFPQLVSLPEDFSKEIAALIFTEGLLLIVGAAIMTKKDK